MNDKRKAKKRKVEGEDPLSDWPVWADQPEYDKRYYMEKVNGLHIKLRVIEWEIYLDQNGGIGQLIETLPTQHYTYEQARQWCREYKESAAKIAAKTVRLDTFKPPLSEKEQEKYRLADEKLRQSDWFQLSKQEQADWDRGSKYEIQKANEEAEKERKIRIDAQKPWLFVITLFGFTFLALGVISELSLLMQFVLGWLLLIGLIYTLIRIHDM